jgi:hypothetical protein
MLVLAAMLPPRHANIRMFLKKRLVQINALVQRLVYQSTVIVGGVPVIICHQCHR